jgi:DnaJ-domain-containing protein 1
VEYTGLFEVGNGDNAVNYYIWVVCMNSHYEILGVDQAASVDEVKRAYRLKILSCHPDRGGRDEDFIKVHAAFEVLTNPQLRREYDASMRAPNPSRAEQDTASSLLRLFYYMPFTSNLEILKKTIIPQYEKLLSEVTETYIFLNRCLFLKLLDNIIFNKLLTSMMTTPDPSSKDVDFQIKMAGKFRALIDKYNHKSALLIRADMMELQDYIQSLLAQAGGYDNYKDVIEIDSFADVWPLELHISVWDACSRNRTEQARAFVVNVLNSSPIKTYLDKGDSHSFGFGADEDDDFSRGRLHFSVLPTYFISKPINNPNVLAIANGNASQENDVMRWKRELMTYLRERSQAPAYTGSMFGFSQKSKVEGAQLLIDALSGRNPHLLFWVGNKVNLNALQQGKLKVIAKEALKYAQTQYKS